VHRKRHPRNARKLERSFGYTLRFPPRDATFYGAFPPMGIFEMGSKRFFIEIMAKIPISDEWTAPDP
jgi:hypothetical protein